jgi:hypothetical protein
MGNIAKKSITKKILNLITPKSIPDAKGIPFVSQSPSWSQVYVQPHMGISKRLLEGITGKKSTGFQYHDAQKTIFNDNNFSVTVVAKGRRFGLTQGFAFYVINRMREGLTPILWVDTVYSNIDKYVNRYFIPMIKQLSIKDYKWSKTDKTLRIDNSTCDFRSADRPENMEGFGYRLMILNEAGIILRNEYLWYNAIKPMALDYSAKIFIGGTPKGKGLFYELYSKAKELDDWTCFTFSSYDNPHIKKIDIDKLASEMPEPVMRQEIWAEFIHDDFQVFRNVSTCIKGKLSDPVEGEVYYAGVDVAKHKDWTVLTIIDSTNHVVYFGRIQHHSWTLQKQWLVQNISKYNAKTLIDSTGLGDVIYDDLLRAGIDIYPYRFTSESKKRLIESLMLSIDQVQITFPDIKVLIDELNEFKYEVTPNGVKYNAPNGHHDDCVISLALANIKVEDNSNSNLSWI